MPVAGGIAALDHEIRDDTMKNGAVVEAFARQENEIVDGLGASLANSSQTMFPLLVSNVTVYLPAGSFRMAAVLSIVWTYLQCNGWGLGDGGSGLGTRD